MSPATPSPARPTHAVVGRYAIYDEIASGGMATVHLGKLLGAGGFSRVVAIKRLHPQFAKDAEFSSMFLDEARLAARIHHPNVVQTLDVVAADKELLLVMEYVHGISFASLLHLARKKRARVDPRIVAAVLAGALEGLHAAHEAKSEVGVPLGVVHRDVSPQNLLVGAEGSPRILDFGVAKAMGNMHATRDGQLKGKLAYMSPEQVRSQSVTRQSDVFSASIVLWEALMGQRLFDGVNPAELIMQVISEPIPAPRARFPDLPPALDGLVMRGLSRDPAGRFATAREMALELEAVVGLAPPREVARWVEALAGTTLEARSQLLERIERAAAETAAADEAARSAPGVAFPATLASAIDTPQSGTHPRSARPIIEEPRSLLPPMELAKAPISSGPGSDDGGSARRSAELRPQTPSDDGGPGRRSAELRPQTPSDDGGPGRRSAELRPQTPSDDGGPGRRSAELRPQTPSDNGGSARRSAELRPQTPSDDEGPRDVPPTVPAHDGALGRGMPPHAAEPQGGIGRGLSPLLQPWGGQQPAPLDPTLPGSGLGSGAPREPRIHRIPAPVEEDAQVSLRERIEAPIKVVAGGVVLSVADALIRPFLPSLPFRLLWIAEVLVVAGVLWLVARLVLPARGR